MPKQPAPKNDVPAKDTVVPDATGEKTAKAAGAPKQQGAGKAPVGKDPATTAQPKPNGPASDTARKGAVPEKQSNSAVTGGSTSETRPGAKDSQAQPAKTQATDARANPTPGDSARKPAAQTTPAPKPGKATAFTAKESETKKTPASSKNAPNATPADQQAKNATDAEPPNRDSVVRGKQPVLPKPGNSASDPESPATTKPVAKPDVKPSQAEAAKIRPEAAKPVVASVHNPGKQATAVPATSPASVKRATAKSASNPGKDAAGSKVVPAAQAPKNGTEPKAASKPVSKPVEAIDAKRAPAEAGEPLPAAPDSSRGVATKEPAPANVPDQRDPLDAGKPESETVSVAKAMPVPASTTESTTPLTADKSAAPVERPADPAPMAQSTPGNPTGKPSKEASRGPMMALMIVSFILEVALLGAVAIWGMAELPLTPAVAVIITVVPVVILWAVFMSPKASLRLPQPFHAVTAHVLFAVGAGLLALSGQPVLAISMGVLIAISLALTVAVRGQNVAGRPPKGTGRRAAR